MKAKLKKFKSFAATLLPVETAYLLSISQHLEPERVAILERIHGNTTAIDDQKDYDLSIDKRKYSRTMKWIKNKLREIDVDRSLQWISAAHTAILTDSVDPELEAAILTSIKHKGPDTYYFIQYYDMLLEYRHYLQIRMRYDQHQTVHEVLERWQYGYRKSRLIYEQLHQASDDIIRLRDDQDSEAIQWKEWLLGTYEDDSLDGRIRYMALIRYAFLCLSYDMLGDLRKVMLTLEQFFSEGKSYSRRILMNYYDNMLVLYDQLGDYDRARYYGYLSIRDETYDSLIYRNNLVNLLIKNRSFDEALLIIEEADFKIGNTKNFHSAIGFVSNHIRCLTKVGRVADALTKGRVFFDAFQKEIMKYRWHRFFNAYLGAMITDGRYLEALKVITKFDLVSREQLHARRDRGALRIIELYALLAKRQTSKMGQKAYRRSIDALLESGWQKQVDDELLSLVRAD